MSEDTSEGPKYQEFLQRVKQELERAGEVTQAELNRAVDTAGRFYQEARNIKKDDVDAMVSGFKQDWRRVMEDVKTGTTKVAESPTMQRLKDRGADFLLGVARKIREAGAALEERLEGDAGNAPASKESEE